MYIKNLVEMDLFPDPFPVRINHNKDPHFQYPTHWHKAIEVVLAAKKDSDIIINQRIYTLKEGDLVFITGGDIHSYPLSEGSERIFILFDLQDLNPKGLWNENRPFISKTTFIRRSRHEALHANVMEQVNHILNEAGNLQAGSKFVLLARIYDLVAIMIRNTNPSENLSGGDRKDLLLKVGQVVEYMEQNYMEPVTLKSAAEKVGFSEHYLSRVFNQAMGSPFHLYLNKIRIQHAESRIILNEGSISDIAFQCGFNSLPTFNRLFRELKGCTPVQYRKMRWDHHTPKEEETES